MFKLIWKVMKFFIALILLIFAVLLIAKAADNWDRNPIDWDCVEEVKATSGYCNSIDRAIDACASAIKARCIPGKKK